ncbi:MULTISPECIES: hypothetical protein [unclassified Streptomyces]
MVDPRNARSLAVAHRLGMRHAETFSAPTGDRTAHCLRLDL